MTTATAERRIPTATYRLQFHRGFPFPAASAVLPYLAELGISDVYSSPVFQARAGSTHGYDICDHSRFSDDLGGADGFAAFADGLRQQQLGLILDIVPNHMGVFDPANRWWWDVLENGPSANAAPNFDIDWHPVKPELANKVLLPILEAQYGRALEAGKFRLGFEDGAFLIYAGAVKLPVGPRAYAPIVALKLEDLAAERGEDDPAVMELRSILTAISYLPPRTESDPARIAERNREKEVIKRRLARLANESAEVQTYLEETLAAYNGDPTDPAVQERMDALLDEQAYRPAYWRVAAEEINYRRFFDINDLAAIRVERAEVFTDAHALPVRLLAEGIVTGLRIDHPDGLWSPVGYFRQLQEAYVQARGASQPVDDWFTAAQSTGRPAWPLYVVAEKILAPGEPLPPDWAVAGTTGYDFLNTVNGLFVERRARPSFDRFYRHFTGVTAPFRQIENASKKMVMLTAMSSEINALAHELERLTAKSRHHRDFTLNSLTFALREVIACLPVYRTYLQGPGTLLPRDLAYIEEAVEGAKARNPRTAEDIFDFLLATLTLTNVEEFPEAVRPGLTHFALKVQQVSGPVTAKGVEDSAFYQYYRLVSLNEVGGDPDHFGTRLSEFHRRCVEQFHAWPHTMLTTSTHDTKRSEDVRARINVLTEMPDDWRRLVRRLARVTVGWRGRAAGTAAPDRNDEYLFYQTVIGAWPRVENTGEPLSPEELTAFRERIDRYMLKAIKEGQRHSSWVNPNEEYEAGVERFVARCLANGEHNPFLAALQPLVHEVAFFGVFNSLSQVLLKLTCPGVPDIYQGCEMWDLSLVDPDNRRPVDFARRRAALAELRQHPDRAALAEELLAHPGDGRIKLFLTHALLNYRKQHADIFDRGAYVPLRVVGGKRRHVVAFARVVDDHGVVSVAPRLVSRLNGAALTPPIGPDVWGDTWLVLAREPVGRPYHNILTGEMLTVQESDGVPGLPLSQVCGRFPVALLERAP